MILAELRDARQGFTALIKDALYPRICPGCGRTSDRDGRCICWDCFSRIEMLDEGCCALCGNPLTANPRNDFICSLCRQNKPSFDRARSAARFSGIMRSVLHDFKYKKALWLTADISDIIEGVLSSCFDLNSIDLVVPVPLFRTRERERLYNQAQVLAGELAERLDRRLDSRSLKRVRATETQTRLNAAQRRVNIKDAFAVVRTQWIRGRTILLVDDVMTTGATLSECSAALKRGGARKVYAVSAARR
jgi:competence protein ComFC